MPLQHPTNAFKSDYYNNKVVYKKSKTTFGSYVLNLLKKFNVY